MEKPKKNLFTSYFFAEHRVEGIIGGCGLLDKLEVCMGKTEQERLFWGGVFPIDL